LLYRDTKFLTLRGVPESADTEVVLLPPRSPNLNAHIERFMRTMKSECLDKMIFFGENSLRRALTEFSEHYKWASHCLLRVCG
jgi:transposase InsO family protein